MPYQVTKKYGHDLGLSCAFRQPKATHSHCSKLHGYALGFEIVFESHSLDERNWVIDFGGLKPLKQKLVDMFDHKTAIAQDDPKLAHFMEMHNEGLLDLVVMRRVGCEAFAKEVYKVVVEIVESINDEYHRSLPYQHRVRVVSVKCSEHGANSATYIGN